MSHPNRGSVLPVLLTGALAASPLALAENTDQILVTATRTPQPLSQTLAPVTVFDRADIERLQARDLVDLLSRVPGVSFGREGGRGAVTALFLRGNNSNHTLVMIDGVRIGSGTTGRASLELLSPATIERIEVVRGPRSSLYGSDAIGGVINIITRREQGDLQPTLRAGIGSNKTREVSASVGGGTEDFNFNATVSDFYTGGTDHTTRKTPPDDDDDAFRQRAISLSMEHRVTEQLTARAFYQDSRSKAEYDNAFACATCNPHRLQRVEALGVELDARILPIWRSSLRYGRSVDDSKERESYTGEIKTTRTQYHWQNDLNLHEQHLLTLGYDFDRDEVSSLTAYDVDERDNKAYYGQLQSQWGVVDTVAGLRHDDNDQYGTFNTGNIAIGANLPGDIRVIASYSEGFKAPTFNDLYGPWGGNPDFRPEESENIELEVRGQHLGVQWSASIFQNDVKNLLISNPMTWQLEQIGRARIQGLEATAATLLAGWDVVLSATLLDHEDRDTGDELTRRPRRYASLDLDRAFGPWQLGMTLRGEGRRLEGANRLAGYGQVNLRAGYRFNPQWLVQAKIDNILDRDYQLSGGYKQPGVEAFLSVTYTP